MGIKEEAAALVESGRHHALLREQLPQLAVLHSVPHISNGRSPYTVLMHVLMSGSLSLGGKGNALLAKLKQVETLAFALQAGRAPPPEQASASALSALRSAAVTLCAKQGIATATAARQPPPCFLEDEACELLNALKQVADWRSQTVASTARLTRACALLDAPGVQRVLWQYTQPAPWASCVRPRLAACQSALQRLARLLERSVCLVDQAVDPERWLAARMGYAAGARQQLRDEVPLVASASSSAASSSSAAVTRPGLEAFVLAYLRGRPRLEARLGPLGNAWNVYRLKHGLPSGGERLKSRLATLSGVTLSNDGSAGFSSEGYVRLLAQPHADAAFGALQPTSGAPAGGAGAGPSSSSAPSFEALPPEYAEATAAFAGAREAAAAVLRLCVAVVDELADDDGSDGSDENEGSGGEEAAGAGDHAAGAGSAARSAEEVRAGRANRWARVQALALQLGEQARLVPHPPPPFLAGKDAPAAVEFLPSLPVERFCAVHGTPATRGHSSDKCAALPRGLGHALAEHRAAHHQQQLLLQPQEAAAAADARPPIAVLAPRRAAAAAAAPLEGAAADRSSQRDRGRSGSVRRASSRSRSRAGSRGATASSRRSRSRSSPRGGGSRGGLRDGRGDDGGGRHQQQQQQQRGAYAAVAGAAYGTGDDGGGWQGGGYEQRCRQYRAAGDRDAAAAAVAPARPASHQPPPPRLESGGPLMAPLLPLPAALTAAPAAAPAVDSTAASLLGMLGNPAQLQLMQLLLQQLQQQPPPPAAPAAPPPAVPATAAAPGVDKTAAEREPPRGGSGRSGRYAADEPQMRGALPPPAWGRSGSGGRGGGGDRDRSRSRGRERSCWDQGGAEAGRRQQHQRQHRGDWDGGRAAAAAREPHRPYDAGGGYNKWSAAAPAEGEYAERGTADTRNWHGGGGGDKDEEADRRRRVRGYSSRSGGSGYDAGCDDAAAAAAASGGGGDFYAATAAGGSEGGVHRDGDGADAAGDYDQPAAAWSPSHSSPGRRRERSQ